MADPASRTAKIHIVPFKFATASDIKIPPYPFGLLFTHAFDIVKMYILMILL